MLSKRHRDLIKGRTHENRYRDSCRESILFRLQGSDDGSVIGQPGPACAMQHCRRFHLEAAHVYAIQPQPWHRRRVGARRLRLRSASRETAEISAESACRNLIVENLLHAKRLAQGSGKIVAPVVEIAGNDHWSITRRGFQHFFDQQVILALSASGEKTEMDHIAMNRRFGRLDNAVQYPARFIGMIRHVLIALRKNWKSADKRIAVMTMAIHCIHSIRGVVRFASQEFMLRLRGPFRCMPGCQQIVPTLHFLQKQYICRHRRHRLLHIAYTGLIADRRHPFVNVVCCNT